MKNSMSAIVTILAIIISSVSIAGADVNLESGFANSPAEARPYTWWHWMNGNVSREGITLDLEAMARVGIGGVQIFNIADSHGCEIPAGPVDYLSDEWLDLVKFTASEAKRLGLKFCIHNCAGWATSGGPWIEAQNASQILVFKEVKVEGGKRIEQKLPQPEVRENFYRDIAVFAFPTPKNDEARLNRWVTAALYKTCRIGRQPSLKPSPLGAAIDPESIVEISGFMDEDGKLIWEAPAGSWTILRLGHTASGKTNHPSPESGRGLEIDKLSREGVDVHWRHGIQPILDHLGSLTVKVLDTIHIDSYEGGFANWTPRFRQEFTQRRGYDPTAYLIALTGRIVGDGPITERFLWDFRRTVADLYADHYYGYFAKQCRDRGLLYSMEPYRGPFESLKVASHADIPMGEFWTQKIYIGSLKLASSAAHLNDRTLVSAEAFTAGPKEGRWLNHPGSLRRIGDLAWTRGINRFVFHRFAHQPWLDLLPGMTMGQYGCHFDRTNTWWEPGRAWMQYIGRSQFLLQSGEFAADVLVFAGEATPNLGVTREDIKNAGFDYDACGTDVFAALKVKDGDVVLSSGKRYGLLVMPDIPFQSPALARKVRDLVRAGAAVLGPKPKYNPSLTGFPASEKEVVAIGEEVWGKCDGTAATSNRFGKGQVFTGISPAEALARLKVAPVVQLAGDLAWIHRRTADADIFFVSNQSGKAVHTIAAFLAAGKKPEFWDAEQGTIRPAPGWTVSGKHVRVPLNLEPEKSVFVVFRHPGKPASDPYVRAEGPTKKPPGFDASKGTRLHAWDNGMHTLHRASGKTSQVKVTGLPEPLTLAGPWDVRFQPKRGAPEKARFDRLMSWTEHTDPGIRYFSGTATTSTRFDLTEGFLQKGQEVWLDLGKVAVMAEVRLNQQNLGILWHHPFRIEVSKALRTGSNTLEVDVTNLWVNRLIGDERYPADCEWTESFLTRWPDWLISGQPRPVPSRITFTTWKHWAAGDPLLPSGLLGPVTLRCARLVPVPYDHATDIINGFEWKSDVPKDCPFEQSETLTGIFFTGRHSDYHCGDTFYPSWASDGNLYSPWTDGPGCSSGGSLKRGFHTAHVVMKGDNPLKLVIKDTSPPKRGWAKPYRGRYPSASLVHNGIWYYGTYCLGPGATYMHSGFKWNFPNLGPMSGFQISKDLGKTWTDSPLSPTNPLFPEPEEFLGPVKMGAPHFVDFGKNMEHSPDGKAYLLAMGAEINDPKPRPCITAGEHGTVYRVNKVCKDRVHLSMRSGEAASEFRESYEKAFKEVDGKPFTHANLSWISADQVYMARVTPSPETINDLKAYEFFAGLNSKGEPVWSNDFSAIKPLIEWNNHMGCVTATYVPGLKKYLMCITDGWPTVAKMSSYILEADQLTGPWRMVVYMKNFGEQAYFLNFPSKFISEDGRTLWLCYSANFSTGWNGVELKFNPPGGRYGLCLHEVRLQGSGDARATANKGVQATR